MARRSFLIFLIFLFLFAGCTNQTNIPTEDDSQLWVDFSYFQNRFDQLPDGVTFSPWQTEQHDSRTIHHTVLSCTDHQCQHTLEITTNSNGKILNITLQSERAASGESCFAKLSYHVFCSMGFQDKDGKGNTTFADADAFYAYFQPLSSENAEQSMWVNSHEVKYSHLSNQETRCFVIHYHT